VGKQSYPLRLDAEHRKLLEEASASEGKPMSQLIAEGIVMRCAAGGTPSSAALQEARGKLAEAAALLERCTSGLPRQEPAQPAADGSWDDLMSGGEAR
jgi:hypothetical protein